MNNYAYTSNGALLKFVKSGPQELPGGTRIIDVWEVVKEPEVCMETFQLTPGVFYLTGITPGDQINYCKCDECSDGYFAKHEAYGWDIISRCSQ